MLCFAVWLTLDAPSLLRSAQAAPLGTRRSVAITLLRPLADVSDALGLSHVVGGADRAMGRTGNTGTGVLQIEGPAVRPHRVLAPSVHVTVPVPTTTPVASSVPVSVPPVSSTTAVTAPDGLAPLAVPTPAAPLRLLVLGDSLGIDFGQPLVNDLAATDVVSAVLDGHIDTGLSRPDYFNWPAELQRDVVTYQPKAVVVFIGANDPQNFIDGSTAVTYGTPAWNAAYGKRVGSLMAQATGAGARVLWVGMPPMADPGLNAKMETLNAIAQNQAAVHPGVTYFASWPVLSNPQGQFSAFLPDASGNEVQVRDPDGIHITAAGAAAPVAGRHRLHGPRVGPGPVATASLWVLRHAKAASQGRDDDHSRPLTTRGTRQATDVGTYLAHASIARSSPPGARAVVLGAPSPPDRRARRGTARSQHPAPGRARPVPR